MYALVHIPLFNKVQIYILYSDIPKSNINKMPLNAPNTISIKYAKGNKDF